MRRVVLNITALFLLGISVFSMNVLYAQGIERVELWPGLAPGETRREADVERAPGQADQVTNPYLLIYRPEKQTSDTCILYLPGGAFEYCHYEIESAPCREYWLSTGRTVAVLVYRVPRPEGKPVYWKAFQDAQRAVRVLRANAKKYSIDPEKIGVQGNSAGGCLALYVATNSMQQVYEPVDELDIVSAKVAFAMPIYPAYVLDDGAQGPNTKKGEGAKMLDDFLFDSQTPPMCLLHGDADVYSSVGSVEVYKKLRKLNIPCELHIFTGAPHGFFSWFNMENANSWRERSDAWLTKMGF